VPCPSDRDSRCWPAGEYVWVRTVICFRPLYCTTEHFVRFQKICRNIHTIKGYIEDRPKTTAQMILADSEGRRSTFSKVQHGKWGAIRDWQFLSWHQRVFRERKIRFTQLLLASNSETLACKEEPLTGNGFKCKIWSFHGSDYEEFRLLGYKNPVLTSQETHYVSATKSSQLMLCTIWGFHGSYYEEFRLLGYKNPVLTSQETHYVSATKLSQLMLCKFWGFHYGDYEECRLLWYICGSSYKSQTA
jgi:hypothetical protein